MKTRCTLLFLLGCTLNTLYAQLPTRSIRRDSVPDTAPLNQMPNARPRNSFYRSPTDPPNVVRATLDNMPVKIPDSSVNYSTLQLQQSTPTLPLLPPGKLRIIPPDVPMLRKKYK